MVLLRVLGLWLALEAFFRMVEVAILLWPMRNLTSTTGGANWTSYPSLPSADLYLHDTYYVVGGSVGMLLVPALKMVVGLLLIVAAPRIARVICRGGEGDDSR